VIHWGCLSPLPPQLVFSVTVIACDLPLHLVRQVVECIPSVMVNPFPLLCHISLPPLVFVDILPVFEWFPFTLLKFLHSNLLAGASINPILPPVSSTFFRSTPPVPALIHTDLMSLISCGPTRNSPPSPCFLTFPSFSCGPPPPSSL